MKTSKALQVQTCIETKVKGLERNTVMMTTFPPSQANNCRGKERRERSPMRRSCDVCAAACTSMQSRPLIIAPICISCSLYACHQKRDPSITQTHGGKKRELFARGMEGDNLNRKKPIGSPISDSGEAINQPGSRQGRKSIDHGREPLSLGGMKPGPRSTHVHSPLPPHRIFDLIMEGSTEGRKIERERKKENPEPDNIPLKTKRLPL